MRLHKDVIPHLTNPHLLADMLSGALESGGLVGMLALHAIFVLVTKHGLEYPDFYARLYQLLQPTAFYVSFLPGCKLSSAKVREFPIGLSNRTFFCS